MTVVKTMTMRTQMRLRMMHQWFATGDGLGNDSASATTSVNNSVTREGNTPQDFFNFLVTEDILQHIVTETNRYTDDYFQECSIPPRSRLQEQKKKAFQVKELLQFFSLLIMGIIHLNLNNSKEMPNQTTTPTIQGDLF